LSTDAKPNTLLKQMSYLAVVTVANLNWPLFLLAYG